MIPPAIISRPCQKTLHAHNGWTCSLLNRRHCLFPKSSWNREVTSRVQSKNADCLGQLHTMLSDADLRTRHSGPGAPVRRLGRIIQRIFLPNQEAALVEPFGNGLERVSFQGLFPPYFWICNASFLCLIYFLPPQLTSPGSPRMDVSQCQS